jgi:SSS family solute:Na+ symporter
MTAAPLRSRGVAFILLARAALAGDVVSAAPAVAGLPSVVNAAAAPQPTTAYRGPPPTTAYRGTTPTLDGIVDAAEWADAAHFARGINAFWPRFAPVAPPAAGIPDLDIDVWVKHDGARLFFAFNASDDLLYRFETPAWLPRGNAAANDLTRNGWPWFGDELEVLLDTLPPCATCPDGGAAGVRGQFQLVVNVAKSRLGGLGVGGILEGEPRSSDTAWANYQDWIYSRAAEAAVASAPGAARGAASHWSAEVALDLATVVGWDAAAPLAARFNIAIGDADTEAESAYTIYGLRHEMWFAGNASGTPYYLSSFAPLLLEPGLPPPQ